MVPQHFEPPHEFRRLSPEVEAQLETALRSLDNKHHSPEALQGALRAAAEDARSRQLRAEELLLVFKQVEQRITTGRADPGSDQSTRNRIIRALIEAYYSQARPGE